MKWEVSWWPRNADHSLNIAEQQNFNWKACEIYNYVASETCLLTTKQLPQLEISVNATYSRHAPKS